MVESGGLENRCGVILHRGFESPSLRSKTMDIIQIKKSIEEWQKILPKADNYKIIKIIQEVISLYPKLDEKQKELFLVNFKTIQKKIFDYIYSNDPFLRKHVVLLAYILNSNELILDVIKYLKLEKDYDNIMVYLDYIDKFKVVGFVENLFDFTKTSDLPFAIKLKTFYIILVLSTGYKSYEKFLDFIFEELKNVFVQSKKMYFQLIVNFLSDFLFYTLNFFSNKECPKNLSVYSSNILSIFSNFYNTLFFRLIDFVKFIIQESEEEDEKIVNIISKSFVLLFIIYCVLKENKYFENQNLQENNEENIYDKINLMNFLKEIIDKEKKMIIVIPFILNDIEECGIKNAFKQYLMENNNLDEDSSFIDYLLKFLGNGKYSNIVLKFIDKLHLSLTNSELEKISEFCRKSINENDILLCLNIMDKNSYYEDIFYFAKYSAGYSEKVKIRIKELLQKMIESKRNE